MEDKSPIERIADSLEKISSIVCDDRIYIRAKMIDALRDINEMQNIKTQIRK